MLRQKSRLGRSLVVSTAALALGLSSTIAYASPQLPAPAPAGGITHEQNDRVPAGAAWTEAYFGSADGVELHADVLRPANLADTDKTPVILSVGPYFGHIGQTDAEGFTHTGPSQRFTDLVDGAGLMERGYTVVMVDLRGFGGSTGCLDWGGPGEQADVDAAIKWAAGQPWSTGKVGLYGKSYDGITGLVANNLGTPGLAAVVAQEPVWDLYNYLFSNGVPRPNVTGTPRSYNGIASLSGMGDDTDHYKKNADYEKSHPECLTNNLTNNNNPDHGSAYWQARNLAARAKGSSTPLFITQGFLENNTKPEAMETYLSNHTGEVRGWLGPWEHVRGNETSSTGQLAMGRQGWFDEVVRFYDAHLRDQAPKVTDPTFAIQDNFGRWRAQNAWSGPRNELKLDLGSGAFVDSGAGARNLAAEDTGQKWDMENARTTAASPAGPKKEDGAGVGTSFTRYSHPTKADVRLTGTPKVNLQVAVPAGVTASQVMVRLWDVDPAADSAASRQAVMFNENVARISGSGELTFELKSQDWKLAAGHSLAVSVGAVDADAGWIVAPANAQVDVKKAELALSTQDPSKDTATEGDRAPWLDAYLKRYTTHIPAEAPSFPIERSAKR